MIKKILAISLLALPVISCDNGTSNRLLEGPVIGLSEASSPTNKGTITLGTSPNIFSAPKGNFSAPSLILEGQLEIEQIEITKDELTWVSLLDQPETITVKTLLNNGSFVSFNVDPVEVEEGEYTGVRITLAKKPPVVIQTNTGESVVGALNSTPRNMSYRVTGIATSQGSQRVATLTTLNGFFTKFNIQTGKNMFLAIEILFQELAEPEWDISVAAKASSVQPS